MDTTQALDWGPEDIADDEQEEAIQVGSLRMSYPEGQSELHPLHTGQNIVGRRGSQPQKDDERLERWRGEYSRNGTVSGLFLDSSLISSPHAIIYVEKGGELCFVKDMNSKNKTFLERGSSLLRLQSGDRYSINNGDTLRFGNVSCQMDVDQAAAALNAQGQAQGERAQGPSTGLPAQDATQAYMSIGDAMEEEGGEGAAAAEAGAAAAVGEEAAGSRGVAAEQVRRPSRPLPPHAAPRPPSIPPAPTTAHHRSPPDLHRQSPTQAWTAFQDSAAAAPQRSHSALIPPVSALSEGIPRPARSANKGLSIDSVSPFSAFAGGDAPGDDPSQNWPQPRPGLAALTPSPFGAAAARQPSMQRAGSIQKVGSLHDWAAFRRSSAERLPSLQDWIMPNLGSSPVSQRCSLPFDAPIPEAFVPTDAALGSSLFCSEALPQPKLALSRPKGIPPSRHPLHRANLMPNNESSADELSVPGTSPGPAWQLRAPRSPARGESGRPQHAARSPPAGAGRAASASPKRVRSSEESEGIFVGSFDDEAQPQKSPRLCRQLPVARAGSPSRGEADAGPGFADFHAVMDSLWGNKGVQPESTPVG